MMRHVPSIIWQLRIERAGFDQNMIDPEEGPGGSLVADSYGIGSDGQDPKPWTLNPGS